MDNKNNKQEFHYLIDSNDHVVGVDRAWEGFAEDNAADLPADRVAGHSLWEFIGGTETRSLYEAVFAAVRERGRPVSIPFRCDSPDLRRFMELRVEPADAGQLALTGILLREEPREHVDLLDDGQRDPNDVLVMCSWCKQVKLTEDNWVEIETAIRELKLFDKATLPALSHGICANCTIVVEHQIDIM